MRRDQGLCDRVYEIGSHQLMTEEWKEIPYKGNFGKKKRLTNLTNQLILNDHKHL